MVGKFTTHIFGLLLQNPALQIQKEYFTLLTIVIPQQFPHYQPKDISFVFGILHIVGWVSHHREDLVDY